MRGEWTTFKSNMDNVITGMLTLFIVSNNEGWPDVMYAFGDATGVETGPKPGASIANCYFFVAFVFVGSFFFLICLLVYSSWVLKRLKEMRKNLCYWTEMRSNGLIWWRWYVEKNLKSLKYLQTGLENNATISWQMMARLQISLWVASF